jgi:vacuolar-type H+-ATPase subunit E/Vma4
VAGDVNAKVAEIREIILAEARSEADRLLRAAEQEAAELLQRSRSEVDREIATRQQLAHEAAERERRTRRAAAASAARARVLAAHAQILEEAIASAGEHLAQLRDRPGYAEWLKALLIEGALALTPHDQIDVLIDERDVSIVDNDFLGAAEVVLTFSHNLGVHLSVVPQRIQTKGGIVLEVRGSNVRCDNTIEERLRATRPELLEHVAAQVFGQ